MQADGANMKQIKSPIGGQKDSCGSKQVGWQADTQLPMFTQCFMGVFLVSRGLEALGFLLFAKLATFSHYYTVILSLEDGTLRSRQQARHLMI